MSSQDSALIRVGLAALLVWSLVTHGKVCPGQTTSSESKPEKLDEYSNLPTDDEAAHLDLFADKLLKQPGLLGQIVAYSDSQVPRGYYLRRINGIARYLTNARGIETNRITVIDGGYKEQFSTELWLIPEGANPPTPIPHLPQPFVNISSAYIFDEECLDCSEAVGLTLDGLDEGLQFYAEALRKYSGARGLIIVRPDVDIGLRKVLSEARTARSLLVKKYGIDASRVAIKSARSRNDGTAVAELWVVPAGAKFPNTTPNKALQRAARKRRLSSMNPVDEIRGDWLKVGAILSPRGNRMRSLI